MYNFYPSNTLKICMLESENKNIQAITGYISGESKKGLSVNN